MDKWKKITYWVMAFAAIIIVSAFSSDRQKMTKTGSITVAIDYTEGHYFITAEDVENIVKAEYPYFDSLFLREINIPVLEETIDNHPSIRKAEVYSKLDGSLQINVLLKKPIARVQNSEASFYIDETGDTMLLSPHYSANVPLINGNFDAEMQEKIFYFFMEAGKDEFYNDFFSGLEISTAGEWVLYPKPGDHRILFGTAENMEGKMKKLKRFYQSMVNHENIDSIKTINLKYKGQVICKRHYNHES